MNDRFRHWLLSAAVPFTKLLGHIHAPYSHKQIKKADLDAALQILSPGMVFITRTEGEMTNPFIPGFWSHAAIYCGGEVVMEAVGKGVSENNLTDFLLEKDHVLILKPTFASPEQMEDAARWAQSKKGLPYDYEFEGGSKKFYCAMLVYAAYKEAMGGQSPFTLRETWGVQTVVPEDFVNAKEKFTEVLRLPVEVQTAAA